MDDRHIHDRHSHLETRVARVEASMESLASGVSEIKELVISIQSAQRREMSDLSHIIDQKTQPRPQLLVGIVSLILTAIGAGWFLVSTQIETLKDAELRESVRVNRRLELIEGHRHSERDGAQDERLRAIERAVFSQEHGGG